MTALGIYVVAGRDWSDALDMIAECTDVAELTTLLAMFENPGGPETDVELNALMVEPVRRRLVALKVPTPPMADPTGELTVHVGPPDCPTTLGDAWIGTTHATQPSSDADVERVARHLWRDVALNVWNYAPDIVTNMEPQPWFLHVIRAAIAAGLDPAKFL